MKSKINTQPIEQVAIDFDKVQLLIYDDIVVISTGRHKDDSFEAIVLNEMACYSVGELITGFSKKVFKPLPLGVEVTLSNN